LAASDIPLHDTYYVIGHFHYIVAPGTLFALFAGIYHWFPRVCGRQLDRRLGLIHFWGSLVTMNLIFMPMFAQGLAGLNRRLFDGGRTYAQSAGFEFSYELQAWAAVALGLLQLAFIANLVLTLRRPRTAASNPWQATTLEWGTGVDRHPSPYVARTDTGVSSVTLGFWLFLASEVMLFGALFSSYALLRVSAVDWPSGQDVLSLALGWTNTLVLIGATGVAIRAALAPHEQVRRRLLMVTTLAIVFLVFKSLEYNAEWQTGLVPSTSTFWAMYYTLTAIHAAHVIGGIAANVWVMAGAASVGEAATSGRLQVLARYWIFVDVVWIVMFVGLYLT
jgi:heme/copper-type cytochrome/quinol oxidase subunit 3